MANTSFANDAMNAVLNGAGGLIADAAWNAYGPQASANTGRVGPGAGKRPRNDPDRAEDPGFDVDGANDAHRDGRMTVRVTRAGKKSVETTRIRYLFERKHDISTIRDGFVYANKQIPGQECQIKLTAGTDADHQLPMRTWHLTHRPFMGIETFWNYKIANNQAANFSSHAVDAMAYPSEVNANTYFKNDICHLKWIRIKVFAKGLTKRPMKYRLLVWRSFMEDADITQTYPFSETFMPVMSANIRKQSISPVNIDYNSIMKETRFRFNSAVSVLADRTFIVGEARTETDSLARHLEDVFIPVNGLLHYYTADMDPESSAQWMNPEKYQRDGFANPTVSNHTYPRQHERIFMALVAYDAMTGEEKATHGCADAGVDLSIERAYRLHKIVSSTDPNVVAAVDL